MYKVVNTDTDETIYEGDDMRAAIVAYRSVEHASFYTDGNEDMRK